MKKLFFVIVLIGIAAAVTAFVMRGGLGAGKAKEADAEAAAPKTLKVSRGNIDLKVATTGKIVSNLDVDIKSKASGQIVLLPFDISDNVTSGQLLAELDPVDENRNVDLKEAALVSANAKLAQAEEQLSIALVDMETQTSSVQSELVAAQIKERDSRARLQRASELAAKTLISKEELDTARSDAATAANNLQQAETRVNETRTLPRTVTMRRHDILLQKSAVRNAQVELEQAKQRLKETRIFAPMDGVITLRPVQSGQIIASGISNVGGGTSLMTLSDVSRIFVSASVDESDIGKVKVDQMAIITADAYPGKRFRGKVIRIAPKGTTTSNVVTFEVKIEVLGDGRDLLKPEMTANVEVQADRRENALMLPNESVQFGKGGYFVELPDGPEKTKQQVVKIGLTDGINTEIIEGVAENQEVAVPTSLQSKWARSQANGQGGPNQGQNFNRGMQMATMRLGGVGGSRGGGGGGGGRH